MIATIVAVAVSRQQDFNIGSVDLIGQTGLDETKIRSAIPIHAGDKLSLSKLQSVAQNLAQNLATKANVMLSDLGIVNFDVHGKTMVFVAVKGPTVFELTPRKGPRSNTKLLGDGNSLYEAMMARLSVLIDGKLMGEDDTNGYALFVDPENRATQLKMRDYALANGDSILKVARESSSVPERQAAVWLLGYTDKNADQVEGLFEATTDVDSTVRNNAMRSLGVATNKLPNIGSNPGATQVVHLLRSGNFTDRNKSSLLMEELTRDGKSANLLAKIKEEAIPGLIEMANWTNPPHAEPARRLLGRTAGLSESEIQQFISKNDFVGLIKKCRELLKA